ncbi:YdbH domain-containing protein [Idiomarina loihiensis]|uniref:YdbH domain-containing protein n=1 Tax=Idiomarina loihiensis TaxID=135577 RepID=UPI00384BB1B4
MKLWRVISFGSSMLLTLLLIVFAIALFGYLYLNQQLKLAGVTDWEVEFEKLTASHIVIKRLEVAIDSVPELEGTSPTAAVNLTKILSMEMPTLLPERIDIKSLQLKGRLLPESVSASLSLINKQQLRLELNSQQPLVANVRVIRQDNQVKLKARYDNALLQANYDYNSGKLKAGGSYLLAAQQFADKITTEPVSVDAKWNGILSPYIESATLESLIAELSGELVVSIKQPTLIKVTDTTTTTTGELQLNLSKGIMASYRLELNSDTENLASLIEYDLPLQLSSLSWELNSRDSLGVSLSNAQQAVNRARWPLKLNAVAKGEKNKTIRLASELSIQQKKWQFNSLDLDYVQLSADSIKFPVAGQSMAISKLTSQFAGTVSTTAAELHSTKPTRIELNAFDNDALAILNFNQIYYPYSEPHNALAEFDLNIHSNAINFEPIRNLEAVFDSKFQYQQQQLTSDGELVLGDHIKVAHHSQINSDRLKSKIEVGKFNWQQLPQLDTLLTNLAPQLVVSKAAISGQTDVTYSINDNRWHLDKGQLEIQQGDWVFDTLSVVNSNIDFGFTANNEQLKVNNAQLNIGSVQQGFALGPITAEFRAQLPFQQPMQSTLDLTSHTIKALGGSISIPNQSYSLTDSFVLPVVFEKISLGELMRQYPSNKISIDGKVSGTIPVYWDSNDLTIERGYLDALAPGGHLQVDSSALVQLAGSNPSLQTLAGVLGNFYYRQLSTTVDYNDNGKLTLAIKLKGSNPELENGRPVELNVSLEEDLPALIKGLQISNSLNDVIRKRVQQKIN